MVELDWHDFDCAVSHLAHDVPADAPGIYGVPRGGLPLAVALSNATGLPLLTSYTPGMIVVDDIVNTGATAQALLRDGAALVLVWVARDTAPVDDRIRTSAILQGDEWIVFPWEDPDRAAHEAALAEASIQ